MGCMWAAIQLNHAVCISMIRNNQHFIFVLSRGFDNLLQFLVNHFYCFDCSCHVAGMSNHIGVGEVQNSQFKLFSAKFFTKFIGNGLSAHLRLKIVGSYFGARNHDANFALIGSLFATIKEISYVWILFRFCNSELIQPFIAYKFTQSVLQSCRWESYMYKVIKRFIIGCERYIMEIQITGLERQFFFLEESFRYLTCTVSTNIVKDNDIAFLDTAVTFAFYDVWQNKLIGNIRIVTLFKSFFSVVYFYAFPVNKKIVSFLCAFPTVISVHGVISANYRGDGSNANFFSFFFEFLQIFSSSMWRCISPVCKSVYVGILKVMLLSHFKKCKEMFVMAVNATIRKETHKVNPAVVLSFLKSIG